MEFLLSRYYRCISACVSDVAQSLEVFVADSIGAPADFPEGEARLVDYNGAKICIVRAEGKLYGIDNTCSHAEAYLVEGEVYADDLEIECPLHGSTFNLVDGEPSGLPATEPVATYNVSEDGGQVVVTGQINET